MYGGAGTATHPLRTIQTIVNEVLAALDTEFAALYEGIGRQSVAPERLLRASLFQAFYSVRSECQRSALTLTKYAAYNELRTHRSLGKDAPIHRAIQHEGRIASVPVVNGFHHHYCRI